MAGQLGIMPAPKWLQTPLAELFHQYAGIAVAWEVVVAELAFAVTVEERFAIVHRFFLQCFDLGGGEYVFALTVGDLGDFLHYAFVECAGLFQIAIKRRALQKSFCVRTCVTGAAIAASGRQRRRAGMNFFINGFLVVQVCLGRQADYTANQFKPSRPPWFALPDCRTDCGAWY